MLDARAEPCNLHGTCQTNNTCFCSNGYKTCRPNDGTLTSATAGCETNIFTDTTNCGECGNVRPPPLPPPSVCKPRRQTLNASPMAASRRTPRSGLSRAPPLCVGF
jgi:hypothetical protein